MTAEALVTHKRVKIYLDKDTALRAHEYTVIVHERETGEEVGGFTFCVSDSGKQVRIGEFVEAAKFGAISPCL